MLQIQNAIKTHEQVTMEMGGGEDWEANAEQLKRENEMLAAAGGGSAAIDPNATNDEKDEGGNDE